MASDAEDGAVEGVGPRDGGRIGAEQVDGIGPEHEDRIGAEYYDSSGYFEEGAEHLLDPHSPFQRYRISEVFRIHRPAADDLVLDLGCGWGTFTAALAPNVRKVIAADFSVRSLELTRRRLQREGLADRSPVLCADAGRLPLSDGSVDVVLAADLVEHLYPDQTRAMLSESARVLRSGGHLILWTPNPGHVLEWLRRVGVLTPDPSHVDYKTLGGIVRALEAVGLEIESARHRPSHLPGLRTLELALQAFVPPLRRRIAVLARRP